VAEVQIACTGCTQRRGSPVLALETGRFTTDRETSAQYQVPVGAVGVRLLCPSCSRQSLFWPTSKTPPCTKCGHVEESYIFGDAQEPKAGQGLSYRDSFSGAAENKAMLDELRKGSVGGWSGGG